MALTSIRVDTTVNKLVPIVSLALLAFAHLGHADVASQAFSPLPQNGACPALMTEAECANHFQTLSRLPQGKARSAYLAGIDSLLRERASLCGGGHKVRLSQNSIY